MSEVNTSLSAAAAAAVAVWHQLLIDGTSGRIIKQRSISVHRKSVA